MKINLLKPSMFDEPCKKKSGIFISILKSILLLAIFESIASIILTPFQLFYFFAKFDMENYSGNPDDIIQFFYNLPPWMTLLNLFLTIILIFAVIICRKKIENGTFFSLGLTKNNFIKDYSIGIIIGLVVFSSAVLINIFTKGLSYCGTGDLTIFNIIYITLFFLGYLFQGLSEELLCRGFLMTAIGRRYNILLAIIINSIFFAVLHLLNPGISILAFINLFLFGVLASLIVIKTNSIWMAAAVHSIWNFVQGNIYGISVSGMGPTPTIFKMNLTDNTIWNGGSFGAEGGLGVTIVLVIAIIIFGLLCLKNSLNNKNPSD